MSKLKQQPDRGEATLDDLMALVDEAAGTIVNLRTENASLMKKLREQQTAEAAELDAQRRRIEELEGLKAAHAALTVELQAARAVSSEVDNRTERMEALEQSVAALTAENAALTKKVQEAQMAAYAKASELDIRGQRIHLLDQTIAALKKDADLCQWMRSKFGNSNFFSHLENLYFSDRPHEKKV